MAITEHSFTPEELQEAIEKTPELINSVKTVLSNKKFIIQDEAEHTAFKQNYAQTITRDLTKQHADKLEADVLEITGIQKKPDEKYYEYFKRATSESLSELKTLKTELQTLKEKGPGASATEKARIEQLEKAIEDKNTELENLKNSTKKEKVESNALAEIKIALSGLRTNFKKGLPESLITMAENTALAKLKSIAQIDDDGNVIFVDKDNKPLVDDKTFKPLTAKELLERELKDIIDTGKKGTGTGSEDGKGKGSKGENGKFESLPDTVKTRVQLTDYLLQLGYVKGSPEMDKILEEHKNLPLR